MSIFNNRLVRKLLKFNKTNILKQGVLTPCGNKKFRLSNRSNEKIIKDIIFAKKIKIIVIIFLIKVDFLSFNGIL